MKVSRQPDAAKSKAMSETSRTKSQNGAFFHFLAAFA